MTAEVVNLRRMRKLKKRDEKEAMASARRAAFSRTKSEKDLNKARLSLSKKKLDEHKREN